MKYKYGTKKDVSDRRERLLRSMPVDEYVTRSEISEHVRGDMDKLVQYGYVRKSVRFYSRAGTQIFRRIP